MTLSVSTIGIANLDAIIEYADNGAISFSIKGDVRYMIEHCEEQEPWNAYECGYTDGIQRNFLSSREAYKWVLKRFLQDLAFEAARLAPN